LSSSEYEELDIIKTKVLFCTEPYSKISADTVKECLGKLNSHNINQTIALYKKWQFDLQSKLKSEMSIDDQKQAKAIFYSLVYKNFDTTPENIE
jgi:hypothetical protein